MNNKKYVFVSEFRGSFAGTLDEIKYYLIDEDLSPFNGEWYELGDEVSVELEVD